MKRFIVAITAAALTAALALPAQAGPVPRTTKWVCVLPDGEVVTFVSAAEAARFGINMAHSRAGQVFADNFGEDYHVDSDRSPELPIKELRARCRLRRVYPKLKSAGCRRPSVVVRNQNS